MKQSQLSFLFKEVGFVLDAPIQETEDAWITMFREQRYKALYEWGFETCDEHLHPSAIFLHQLSLIHIFPFG